MFDFFMYSMMFIIAINMASFIIALITEKTDFLKTVSLAITIIMFLNVLVFFIFNLKILLIYIILIFIISLIKALINKRRK